MASIRMIACDCGCAQHPLLPASLFAQTDERLYARLDALDRIADLLESHALLTETCARLMAVLVPDGTPDARD